MTILQKIEALNKYVDGSLSIACNITDTRGWSLHSYKDNTLFTERKEAHTDWVYADTFREVVNKAYRLMLQDKRKKLAKGVKTRQETERIVKRVRTRQEIKRIDEAVRKLIRLD